MRRRLLAFPAVPMRAIPRQVLVTPSIYLVSIGIAAFDSELAQWSWIHLFVAEILDRS